MTGLSNETKHVCHSCIGDQFIAAEVEEKYPPIVCSYCGQACPPLDLEGMADRVHDVLQEHFEHTLTYPSDPHEGLLAEQGMWGRKGRYVGDVIAEMAGLSPQIASDVRTLLFNRLARHTNIEEGEENPYSPVAMYEEQEVDDIDFRLSWIEFRREIGSRSRFFNVKAEERLDEIFEDLASLSTYYGDPIIHTINPGDKDSYFWRARVARSREELTDILGSLPGGIGPPPSEKATDGRMNARGIPVFYGAIKEKTCVSEVRPPVGSYVVVGKFELLHPVRLLDLGALEEVFVGGSFFQADYWERKSHEAFLRRVVGEISRPVLPDEENTEYLSTQVVAEYLSNKVQSRIDGILFPSSQAADDDQNVVLFNHASGVEPQNPASRTGLRIVIPRNSRSAVEDELSEVLMIEVHAPKQHNEATPNGLSEQWGFPTGLPENSEAEKIREGGNPTLRLDTSSVRVLEITGVEYKSVPHTIRRVINAEAEIKTGTPTILASATLTGPEK